MKEIKFLSQKLDTQSLSWCGFSNSQRFHSLRLGVFGGGETYVSFNFSDSLFYF